MDVISRFVHLIDLLQPELFYPEVSISESCFNSNIIESSEITYNYIVAWRLLTERYHSKRVIIRNHIRDLFELESEKRGTPMQLRKLLDDVQRHIRSLKALQQPTEHCDLLLIHLVAAKLYHQSLYHCI